MNNNLKYNLKYIVDPNISSIKYVKSASEKKFLKYNYSDSVVRADQKNFLVSILFNTNNLENTKNCLKKYKEVTQNPRDIQFCIKIDNNDTLFVERFIEALEDFNFNFVVVASPKGRGYIDLWQWINFLYKVSSKKSYFLLNISDEMYIKEKNWDINLSKYKKLLPDNIYKLRTSVFKNRNYNNLFECGYAPDTTSFYTKKYIDLQGGFSPCFGPDNGQQFVSFYLCNLNYPSHYQFNREMVINNINFLGEGTNKNLVGKSLEERKIINYILWLNMFKHQFQQDYLHRARKIQVAIIEGMSKDYKIIHNSRKLSYSLTITDNNTPQNTEILLSYRLSKIKNFLYYFGKQNFFKYHTSYSMSPLSGFTAHFIIKYLKILPQKNLSYKFWLKKLKNSFLILLSPSVFLYFQSLSNKNKQKVHLRKNVAILAVDKGDQSKTISVRGKK